MVLGRPLGGLGRTWRHRGALLSPLDSLLAGLEASWSDLKGLWQCWDSVLSLLPCLGGPGGQGTGGGQKGQWGIAGQKTFQSGLATFAPRTPHAIQH